MRLQNPLSVVTPTLEAGILHVLARAAASFTVPKIQGLMPDAGSLNGLRQAIARLVQQGIVLEERHGNAFVYELNREHLNAGPIIEMAQTKRRLVAGMKQLVQSWYVEPLAVTMFGSAARDEMTLDSDIDLFVVLPDDAGDVLANEDLNRFSETVSKWTGNDTRLLVYQESEITPAPVFDSIMREGIHIAGERAWLERRLRTSKVVS